MRGSCGGVWYRHRWVRRVIYEVGRTFLLTSVSSFVVVSREVNYWAVAEQRITPWQDDADVTKCPLCSCVPLSSLTTDTRSHVFIIARHSTHSRTGSIIVDYVVRLSVHCLLND